MQTVIAISIVVGLIGTIAALKFIASRLSKNKKNCCK